MGVGSSRPLSRSWTSNENPSSTLADLGVAQLAPVPARKENESSGGTSPWSNRDPNVQTCDTTPTDRAPHTNTATPATDLSEEIEVPGPHASVEERFSYVLDCARRVGFGWDFDALAMQYYADDFEWGSALALEQRMSRNRRLPGLLAKLRQCVPTWSSGQRRGYQDEILKAAEDICARECSEFYRKYRQEGKKNDGANDEEGDGGTTAIMLEDHVSTTSSFSLLVGAAESWQMVTRIAEPGHLNLPWVGLLTAVAEASYRVMCSR